MEVREVMEEARAKKTKKAADSLFQKWVAYVKSVPKGRGLTPAESILAFIQSRLVATNTKRTYLGALLGAVRRNMGMTLGSDQSVKDYQAGLQRRLLRYKVKKAPIFSEAALARLQQDPDPQWRAMWDTLDAGGNRHADLTRLLTDDVTAKTVRELQVKFCEAKNIKKVRDQARVTMQISAETWRWIHTEKRSRKQGAILFPLSYGRSLLRLRQLAGQQYGLHSFRRTTMERARTRAKSGAEMQSAFFLRDEKTMRGYLEAPLADEMAVHRRLLQR